MEDRRKRVREIAEIFRFLVGTVHNTLQAKFEIKKICARWVLRLLTIDQKRTRKDISEQWVAPDENASKRAKSVSLAHKNILFIKATLRLTLLQFNMVKLHKNFLVRHDWT